MASVDDDAAAPDWSATAFGGVLLDNDFQELVNPGAIDADESGLFGVAIARKIAEPIGGLDIELEAQLVRHFGGQDHWEIAAPVIARWTEFPWDETVDSSIAFGLGVSFTSEEPVIERQL